MNKIFLKKSCSLILVSALIFSLFQPNRASSESNLISVPSDMVLTDQKTYSLGSGVTEFHVETNNNTGTSPVKSYIAQIDLNKNVTILANYGKYYNSTDPDEWTITSWSRSRTSSQANRYIKATGGEVLVATNGDFYSMSNGKPKGALVINGITYHEASDRPYFAMLDDGTAVIRDAGSQITSDVIQAVGGSYMPVKDGQITPTATTGNVTLTPCNAIGIRGDGSVIIFMVDGRDDDVSVGYTLYDQARMLISLGCVNALCLDCGGSSTFVSKHKDSDSLEIQNNPSDGKERSVSSTLMIVATENLQPDTPVATSKPSNDSNSSSDKDDTSDNKTDDTTNNKTNNTTSNKTNSSTNNKNNSSTNNKNNSSTNNKTNSSTNSSATFTTSGFATTQSLSQVIFSSVKKFKYGKNLYRITSKKNKTVAFCDTVRNKPKSIVIPSTVKYQGVTYKVTAIDKKACANNTKLTKIKFGKYIKTIKNKAFYKCTSLKKVIGLKKFADISFRKFYKKYVLLQEVK